MTIRHLKLVTYVKLSFFFFIYFFMIVSLPFTFIFVRAEVICSQTYLLITLFFCVAAIFISLNELIWTILFFTFKDYDHDLQIYHQPHLYTGLLTILSSVLFFFMYFLFFEASPTIYRPLSIFEVIFIAS